MLEVRETERLVKKHLQERGVPVDSERDAQMLADALAAMSQAKPQPVWFGQEITRAIGRRRSARLAVGVVTILLMVSLAIRFSRPVWALDQVIETLKQYRACNLTMIDSAGVVFDVWAKAEPSGELSDEITIKGSHGGVVWVRDNRTYFYNPKTNTVEVDDAKTAGFSPWLGPEMMKLMAKADDARTFYGKDSATGRDLVVMTGSLTTAAGPISWSMEFDRESKLPTAYKHWDKPRRSGAPSLSIVRIVYYRDPPEGVLRIDVPGGATFTPKAIILPEANLALMGNPNHGIPAERLTRAQASRMILEQVYKASIAGDLATMRRLCPLTGAWSDELLRAIVFGEDEGKRLAEVVDIGAILREGHNRVGPFVVVPTRLKTRDGRLWDERQIVQFRRIDGRDSCVVYGPYGTLSEVK